MKTLEASLPLLFLCQPSFNSSANHVGTTFIRHIEFEYFSPTSTTVTLLQATIISWLDSGLSLLFLPPASTHLQSIFQVVTRKMLFKWWQHVVAQNPPWPPITFKAKSKVLPLPLAHCSPPSLASLLALTTSSQFQPQDLCTALCLDCVVSSLDSFESLL